MSCRQPVRTEKASVRENNYCDMLPNLKTDMKKVWKLNLGANNTLLPPSSLW